MNLCIHSILLFIILQRHYMRGVFVKFIMLFWQWFCNVFLYLFFFICFYLFCMVLLFYDLQVFYSLFTWGIHWKMEMRVTFDHRKLYNTILVRMFFKLYKKNVHYFKTWRYITIKKIIFNSFLPLEEVKQAIITHFGVISSNIFYYF